jgi:MoaA/NifB/PqqE/SkfB family radical SAM enzyme
MTTLENESAANMYRTSIISGLRLTIIRLGVALTILKIALKIDPNPFKAIGLLRSLIKERLTIHDNAGQYKAVRSGKRYYWSINIPGWPSETFNHFIYNEFQRIYSPENSSLQSIIFAITNICPLRCVHCYESDNLSDKNKLSVEDLKLIMAEILSKEIKHIQFTGGEPLSRFEDMIDLMQAAGSTIEYWINTSGFGLTREKARIMKQAGMIGAIISLDNWDESRHNAFRSNNKSFYWVKEAMKNCIEAGIITCLSICPVKEFVSEENLERFYLLAKNLGAGFIRILEPRNAGKLSGKDVRLNSYQINTIDRFMITHNSDKAFADYPVIQFPGHHQRKSGCMGAGNRYLYIDSNGDYHACPFCRGSLGNAMNISITEGISRARIAGCQAFKQRSIV